MLAALQLMRVAQLGRTLLRFAPAYRRIRFEPPPRTAAEGEELLDRLRWHAGPAYERLDVRDGGRGGRELVLIHSLDQQVPLRSALSRRVIDEKASGKTAVVAAAKLAHADLLTLRMKREIDANSQLRRRAFRDDLQAYAGAQLFATGPSIETVTREDVSSRGVGGTLRIACNSVVSNRALLDLLDPHVLTFGDPAFHFGDSEYARTFRADLADAMSRRPNMWVIVPAEYYPALHRDFGDCGRLVPCHVAAPRRFDPRLFEKANRLLRTGNILTSAMLPIAATVGGAIELFGCDGRAPDDDGFWKHSGSAQYQALYASVVSRHPSFFRDTSYEGYYEQHCRRLAHMLNQIEAMGIDVRSKTPSHIPSLSERYVGGGAG